MRLSSNCSTRPRTNTPPGYGPSRRPVANARHRAGGGQDGGFH